MLPVYVSTIVVWIIIAVGVRRGKRAEWSSSPQTTSSPACRRRIFGLHFEKRGEHLVFHFCIGVATACCRRDAVAKADELRSLVGERYHDLMDSVDDTVNMFHTVEGLQKLLGELRQVTAGLAGKAHSRFPEK